MLCYNDLSSTNQKKKCTASILPKRYQIGPCVTV